jgi:hypothetical protein
MQDLPARDAQRVGKSVARLDDDKHVFVASMPAKGLEKGPCQIDTCCA